MKEQSITNVFEQIAVPLATIASPQRIALLLAIGRGEVCVCHLETIFGWRQAYISQHLMALRKAGILQVRRQGRYIYYRLKNASYLGLLTASASLGGISAETVSDLINTNTYPSFECTPCAPALISASPLKTHKV